ncbi:MAG: hypothetical protein HKN09_07280 [Saprospiraceae bacterium]|nr:hypothetical protein [Saprospiraceae bacterium]
MNTKLIMLILVLLFAGSTQAQTVVLVNGNAKRVALKNGEIVSIDKDMPGYMAGYIKPKNDIFTLVNPQLESSEELLAATEPTEVEARPIKLANSLEFESGSAILSNETIEAIKQYAEKAKSEPNKTIILQAYYKTGDTSSQDLTLNRLDACKQLLELNGVQSSLIFTTFSGSNAPGDYVDVTFQ